MKAYPDLLLTYTGTKCDEEETHQAIDVQGTLSGMRVCLIVADPLQKKDASSQRYAVVLYLVVNSNKLSYHIQINGLKKKRDKMSLVCFRK